MSTPPPLKFQPSCAQGPKCMHTTTRERFPPTHILVQPSHCDNLIGRTALVAERDKTTQVGAYARAADI